jgi:hypothetical protein
LGNKMFAEQRSGWDVASFAAESGVARATLYNLWSSQGQLGPRFVHIGRRRVIIESPAEWLQRVAASQRAGTRGGRP